MKKSGKIALTILQFGAVILFAAFFYITTQRTMEPVTVYQLVQDIPMNSKIGESDFKRVDIPRDALTPQMLTEEAMEEIGDITNKHAATRLFANQYATVEMFVDQDEVDPFEIADLSKLRKVTIPATYIDAVGGNLQYGDSVDLVYTGEGEADENETYIYSQMFMQDVLVYGVTTDDGFRYEDRTDRTKGVLTSMDEGEEMGSEDTGDLAQITLAVTPAQAEEIATRMEKGAIKVVGRFKESTNVDPAGFIIGEYNRVFTGNQLAETNTNSNTNTDLNKANEESAEESTEDAKEEEKEESNE